MKESAEATPPALPPGVPGFLSPDMPHAERVLAIEAALRSPMGPMLRSHMANVIVQRLSVLVPEIYARWRTLVADCMMFVVLHLSPERLAPKLVDQMDLPPDLPAEQRLLGLIAKVPGLQKIGQVLARNRHLDPPVRRALSVLENGISDVSAAEIRAIIFAELGPPLKAYKVKVADRILSEASVSAVIRFTWRNPASGRRERGVFKVLKPHIPRYYAEDMHFLHELAHFLGRRDRDKDGCYGVPAAGIADTFGKVRRLLQHEVDFHREQRTLVKAQEQYGALSGVRVPRLIQPLCTSNITALTEERGKKVTDAVRGMSADDRERVAEQLIETLLAVPLFARGDKTMFHADPHAGNLLYDKRHAELVLLDWALPEFLSREQRRHMALLFLMMMLRDAAGLREQIEALSQRRSGRGQAQPRLIAECVDRFLRELPVARRPRPLDATRLLERAALVGVRFPAPLVMLAKVMSMLDGILHDIAAPRAQVEVILARHLMRHWARDFRQFGAPLSLHDWLGLQWSALGYPGRVWEQWTRTLLPGADAAPSSRVWD